MWGVDGKPLYIYLIPSTWLSFTTFVYIYLIVRENICLDEARSYKEAIASKQTSYCLVEINKEI